MPVMKITKGCRTGRRAAPVYHVISGTGTITLGQETHALRPRSVAVSPAGVMHSLEAGPGPELEFVVLGVPPMSIDDERVRPMRG